MEFHVPPDFANLCRLWHIVCDDTKTAVAYFMELKRKVKQQLTLDIIKAPRHGATAQDIVDRAAQYASNLHIDRPEHNSANRDIVWALIDLEGEANRQAQANLVKGKANESDVQIALSNPCFEIWTLMHLADTGAAFVDCQAVVRRIRTEWKKVFGSEFNSQKAQADYHKLMQHRDTALARSKRRQQSHDPSRTEVYKVIESINSLVDQIEATRKRTLNPH